MTSLAPPTKRARAKRFALVVVTALAALAAPGLAFAQEFEKVSGKATEEVPAGRFVGLAYGFIWVALLLYVLSIARDLRRVRDDLASVRRKVDDADKR